MQLFHKDLPPGRDSDHHIIQFSFQNQPYFVRIVCIYDHQDTLLKESILDLRRFILQRQKAALPCYGSQIYKLFDQFGDIIAVSPV